MNIPNPVITLELQVGELQVLIDALSEYSNVENPVGYRVVASHMLSTLKQAVTYKAGE